MKTTCLIGNLLLVVGYPMSLAAEALGVLSASIISFPGFVTACVTFWMLALVCREYSRKPAGSLHRKPAASRQPASSAVPAHAGDTTWVLQTATTFS